MDSKTKPEVPSTGGRADEPSRQEGLSTRRLQQFRADKFAHFFLLLILVAATVVFFKMIKAFLVPIILAAVFAGLFFPFYSWLLKKAGGRKSLSAFVCCATLSLGLLLPAYALANLGAREAVRLYQSAESKGNGRFEENIHASCRGILSSRSCILKKCRSREPLSASQNKRPNSSQMPSTWRREKPSS